MEKRIDLYRRMLLEAGFSEAPVRPGHFWRIATDKTAFIVNLKELEQGVGVVYGFYSTAVLWNEREWEWYRQYGTSDDGCNLRFWLEIPSEAEETRAAETVRELYMQYHETDKDKS